ncbi:MAG: histidine--tRNA ligase [Burkholderiaceae bacterium]|nr:histidine--tRNA ligase [Burkholderiaceae bacterium]
MSSHKPITAIKGMNDILPPDSARWEWLEHVVRQTMAAFAYRNIRTPIVEHTQLFARGLGAATDVVEKEMYSFEDRADKHGSADHLSLRPENTAGVVRAVAEHNLLYDGGKRLFYMGPMFRRERPQRGRYRQFHQIGAEALGFGSPQIDAEIILLAVELWRALGIGNWHLELNSLGQPGERRAHRQALIDYFEAHASQLDEDARRRLHLNPLRILDTKNPAMQALVEAAPKLVDHLGEASLRHFEQVQAILRASGVACRINPRLVRGLDYYNLTVFEFITESLGAQGTICGGGRYDYLIEQLGGKPAPAVGWAMGVERVLELLAQEGIAAPQPAPDAYAVLPDDAASPQAMHCLQQLRALGVRVQMHASAGEGLGSMKSQLKKADASGARFALIFGADELAAGQVTIKALRDGAGAQQQQPLTQVQAWASGLKSAN